MPRNARPSELMVQAGLRLRAVRLALDIQQASFANVLGVSRQALANWEGGTRLVDVPAMVRLAGAFQIPLDWIFLGSLAMVPFDLADKLRVISAEIGAVVGGPVAEFPAAVATKPGLAGQRVPAAVPARSRRVGYLHEKPPR